MIFPISDDDRHLSKPAIVTWTFLILNIAIYLYQTSNPEFTSGWSVIPKEISTGEDLVGAEYITAPTGEQVAIPQTPGPSLIYLTMISAMFMHGGIMHLGGNLLYLWIFGDNVEHRFGSVMFALFYLISGLAATLAQVALGPDSIIPNLGASGAIAGVLGAYLVLFPRNKVNAVFFLRVISIPAIFVLGMWIIMQFVSGAGSLSKTGESGGVAYAAHIGGFIAGVVMALIARVFMKEESDNILLRNYQNDPTAKRGVF